ncbi:peroxisomal membrane protein PMP34 [Tribolium castaneum]|uniref:Calcium-binding mitochondrial carrier protein Aralar1-like Protein n=1 Tax=Tribolium castaneum TaxID=7070 RepID=D6WSQ9_TRICA|nr:PREDICTED: peroxisomal membrane protein PMP34 [Tribolium castaneum]EFA05880.1 Calcium-binding mitochondrial carrier protein Aralar1-like Protein [Tribolium castaneum]|eukprot:XP_971751.1 PREDICTED: peroxisomal membrane protein PMP34 [Tribolium castaneum]
MAKKSIFTYETLVHATAGAAGSIVASSVMYPLDNVKFRMQLEDSSLAGKTALQALFYLLKKEGLEGLYRGIKPQLTTLGISNFIYFYAFHGLKSLKLNNCKNPTQTDLILSIVAGIINVITTNPLWVVNSRLKFSRELYFTGLLDGIVHIADSEGVRALWSSLGPSLMLVSNPAINFTIYEALKRRTSSRTALAFFVMGAISKAVSTIATYPLQVAQTRQRYNRDAKMNTAALLLDMVKKSGPGALFQGLEAKLLQTILSSALMFMTYEKIAQFVFTLLMNKKTT